MALVPQEPRKPNSGRPLRAFLEATLIDTRTVVVIYVIGLALRLTNEDAENRFLYDIGMTLITIAFLHSAVFFYVHLTRPKDKK